MARDDKSTYSASVMSDEELDGRQQGDSVQRWHVIRKVERSVKRVASQGLIAWTDPTLARERQPRGVIRL
jgi:hypothetical protein